MSDKKTIAFVDHSFHQKTRSTFFFRDILADKYELTDYWDRSWEGGESVNIDDISRYDLVVFFQLLPKYSNLLRLRRPAVWIPMYDGETINPWRIDKILYYKLVAKTNIKVLCFSKKHGEFLSKMGFDCIDVQYFLKPFDDGSRDYSGMKILFWDRGDISFDMVKRAIGDQKIDRFILRANYDPGRSNALPANEDIKKYSMEIIKGNLTKDEHLELMRRSNIFIAPRKREGIGMSFLEAMQMGLCVIANNDATMNEYIKDGESGFLTDWSGQTDLKNFKSAGIAARKSVLDGYEQWKDQALEITRFIDFEYQAPKVTEFRRYLMYMLWKILDRFFGILQLLLKR